MPKDVILENPRNLNPHEEIKPFRVLYVLFKVLFDGFFTEPILIDRYSKTILDGHHRHLVSKILGFKHVPCYCVDYLENIMIEVLPRRADIPVNKIDVISHAKRGEKYPHKTTKHILKISKPQTHIPIKVLWA